MASRHYVWIWLPGDEGPTLCGLLEWDGQAAGFAYVRSYREGARSISVHPDWPLTKERGARTFPPEDDPLPGFVADVAPGRWGEYVIGKLRPGATPSALDYLLAGRDGRTGALEFTDAHDRPPEDEKAFVSLGEVAAGVDRLDRGLPVDPEIRSLFRHGPSLGGRRPKASVRHDGALWVAKFASHRDRDHHQPRFEFFALALAARIGLEVPEHRIEQIDGRPVLLVKRFDRGPGGRRVHVLSVRSLLGLSERQMLSEASYPAVARRLAAIGRTSDLGHRWFDRMAFNVLVGNTDDHALNHLLAWNGRQLDLLPAFDLEPQVADPDNRHHEMVIGRQGRLGSVGNVLSHSRAFGLGPAGAAQRVERMQALIGHHWDATAQEARLDAEARDRLRATMLATNGSSRGG